MMAALSVTYLLSILLQNLLFCIPIVAVLLRKSGCLAMQNNRFYDTKPPLLFFKRIIFTKPRLFSISPFKVHNISGNTIFSKQDCFFVGVRNAINLYSYYIIYSLKSRFAPVLSKQIKTVSTDK